MSMSLVPGPEVSDIAWAMVVCLAERGLPWEEISAKAGLPVKQAKAVLAEEVRQPRYPETTREARMKIYERQLWDVMEYSREMILDPGYMYDIKGGLVCGPDGEPLVDTDARAKGARELIRAQESLRKLKGDDPPARRHVTVETAKVDEEVRATLLRIQEAAARGELPQPPAPVWEAEVVSESDGLEGSDAAEGVD